MRNYPEDNYDKERLTKLNAEPWMVELLQINPCYTYWGNEEDYMYNNGKGWDSSVELEKFADMWKLDELNECANFYFEIVRDSHSCNECNGSGYNKETAKLSDDFYGIGDKYAKWCYQLTQDEVDALWEHRRLQSDFDTKPTAEQVNEMAKAKPLFHDSINHHICLQTRAKRLGVYGKCPICGGDGIKYNEDAAHVELQLWILHPRKGASRGVRIRRINKEDLPDVMKFLQTARDRNNERFGSIDKISNIN